ncbi:MAG: hypothetical protein QM790_10625 [Nibricoccus sp.]
MTTKEDRRAIAKRLLIDRLSERSKVTGFEFMWSVGLKMPAGFKKPPRWVRGAISYMVNSGSLSFLNELRDPANVLRPEGFGRVLGMTVLAKAYFEAPPKGLYDEAPAVRESVQELHSKLASVLGPEIEKATTAIPKVAAAIDLKSPTGLHQYIKGQERGARYVMEDQPKDDATTDICFLFWIFWPELTTSRTRVEAHEWLKEMKFVSCSFKQFEKVCGMIGFQPAKQGRPRKSLLRKKKK